uniref:Uncharacterized protein n=1 Tax=Solanum lycopersicum TaxID=4081 RepID=A0A3Q7GY45_SOLLC
MMAGLMQSSLCHFRGQSFQGCRQWETGNIGISQFELSTQGTSGPCICPTKDEQRSTTEDVVSANFPHHQSAIPRYMAQVPPNVDVKLSGRGTKLLIVTLAIPRDMAREPPNGCEAF